jgi:hypothetical protein
MFSVEGGTPQQRSQVTRWAEACAKILPIGKKMHVRIQIDHPDHDFNENEGSYEPHSGALRISFKDENILRTLCHEWIHVNQIARGDLRSGHAVGYVRWKGIEYENADTTGPVRFLAEMTVRGRLSRHAAIQAVKEIEKEYMNQPWEKEAFARQDEFVERVLRAI